MQVAPLVTLMLAIVSMLAIPSRAHGLERQQDEPRVAPFEDIRFDGAAIEIAVDDVWYRWRSIDRVSVDRLVAFAQKEYGRLWEKRIAEDLTRVMAAMGHAPGAAVDLGVARLDDGAELVLVDVAMTAANRDAVWRARHRPPQAAPPPAPPDDAAACLEDLVRLVGERHAYAALRQVDLEAEAAAALERLGPEPAHEDLLLEMHTIVCRLGDGHAGIGDFERALPAGYLPVLLAPARGGVVAVQPDRSALLDPQRPYVIAIDGRPLREWLDGVAPFVPAGSPQLVRERSLRLLRWVQFGRRRLGAAEAPDVRLTVAGADGDDERVIVLPLAAQRPMYGDWPRRPGGMIDGGIGYLRIASMSLDAAGLDRLRDELDALAATPALRGVIVDVRGNGGGARDAMRFVLPYFIDPAAPGDGVVVVNAARYRLQTGDQPDRAEGYLQNRELHPLSWPGWTDAERAVLRDFAAGFRPRWQPPDDAGFSAWHYAIVSRARHGPEAPYIDAPLVVLIDGGCFSATDVFAGACAALPGATLVGTPTAGGSARSQRHALEPCVTSVRLATMISFRPDGRLYDGDGIEPDVPVEPEPEYWIDGGRDVQLERAVEFLSREVLPIEP